MVACKDAIGYENEHENASRTNLGISMTKQSFKRDWARCLLNNHDCTSQPLHLTASMIDIRKYHVDVPLLPLIVDDAILISD